MTRKSNPMTRKWHALAKDSRGSAFVEFALLAPVFFLVILGIIDFGRMMWTSNTVEHAATEGARYAAVRRAAAGCRFPWADSVAAYGRELYRLDDA